MSKEYDRTKLDELIRPYVLDNIRSGFPQYNVVDWVMQAYPQYSAEIKEKTLELMSTASLREDGKYSFAEDAVKEFIKSWMKPSREVRKTHAKQNRKNIT